MPHAERLSTGEVGLIVSEEEAEAIMALLGRCSACEGFDFIYTHGLYTVLLDNIFHGKKSPSRGISVWHTESGTTYEKLEGSLKVYKNKT